MASIPSSFEPKSSTPNGNGNGANYRGPFAIMTSLFFLWGFMTVFNDILIPRFKEAFTLSYFQAMLVQFAFFGAYFTGALIYFIISWLSGDPIAKIGYKNGVVIGLLISAVGSALFWPAANAASYPMFLAGLFIVGLGFAMLQIAANPYVTILGPEKTASSRLNLAQGFNSIGTTIGPLIGGYLIFQYFAKTGAHGAESVKMPYMAFCVIFLVLAAIFFFIHLPHVGEGRVEPGAGALKYPHVVLGVIAIFMYVGGEVSVGSGIINFLGQKSVAGLTADEASKYVAIYWGGLMIGRFMGAVELSEMRAARKQLLLVVIPLLAWLLLWIAKSAPLDALQGDDGSSILNLWRERFVANASVFKIYLPFVGLCWLLFQFGRSLAARTLLIFSLTVCALLLTAILVGGPVAMWCVVAVGLFSSIGWSNTFSLALEGTGVYKSQVSSLLVMAILGGAVLPPLMGAIADATKNLQIAFIVPLIAYAYVAFYGAIGHRIGRNPASAAISNPAMPQIKRGDLRAKTLIGGLLAFAGFFWPVAAQSQVEYVDPTIGGIGYLLEPTRPTVSLPNSLVRVYPVRKDATDDQIHSFPLTIISHRQGELFWLMPCAGVPDDDAWSRPAAYDQEKTTPYYYSTRLDDSGIRIEFTPAARCGCFRFTFPVGKPTVLLANRRKGEMQVETNNAVSGVEHFDGMAAYFYGEFSAPISVQSSTAGDQGRLAVTAGGNAPTLEFRYGISFISIAQARQNLHAEIPAWDFDQIRAQARQCWNDTLGQIQVEGGTPAQKRVFYTALYHCYERMVCISEDGRYYSAFDHRVHEDARPFYVDNWIWDLFQAQEPLMEILQPEMVADEIASYVRMYEQSGWMPSFAELFGDWPAMTGNHAAAWMADAWFKGIRNFDLKTAYAGLRKNSLDATLLPWLNGPKTPLDEFYNAHGYMPGLRPGEKETEPKVSPVESRQSVSVTLDNSYDDWCLAQLAGELGNPADRELFLKRAAYYTNVFRVDKGIMWPKDAAGNWIEPFDPKFPAGFGGRAYFTENNGYTYNWDVKHDLRGLFALMGGTKAAEAKLDQLFREDLGAAKYQFYALIPDSTGMVGQFSMGNEPSFQIPYLYNYLGAPWKTQKRVRMLLETCFPDTLLGMPGDEDGGGISSWVVFAMMGFYPGVPGVPAYCLGSPVFDRVTIRLKNGKTLRVIARNNSHDNKYIQSFRLNGQPSRRVWFRHEDIANGGTLELEMGNLPNKTLGADPADFPPSEMSLSPKNLE